MEEGPIGICRFVDSLNINSPIYSSNPIKIKKEMLILMVFVFVATAVEFFASTEGVYLFYLVIGFVQLANHTKEKLESPGHLNYNIT